MKDIKTARLINAPNRRLKRLQHGLLRLLEQHSLPDAAVGFRKGRSIKHGALRHVDKAVDRRRNGRARLTP